MMRGQPTEKISYKIVDCLFIALQATAYLRDQHVAGCLYLFLHCLILFQGQCFDAVNRQEVVHFETDESINGNCALTFAAI